MAADVRVENLCGEVHQWWSQWVAVVVVVVEMGVVVMVVVVMWLSCCG